MPKISVTRWVKRGQRENDILYEAGLFPQWMRDDMKLCQYRYKKDAERAFGEGKAERVRITCEMDVERFA